jgi:hypothetical protein
MIVYLLATEKKSCGEYPRRQCMPGIRRINHLIERLQMSSVVSWATTARPQSSINAAVFDVGSIAIV